MGKKAGEGDLLGWPGSLFGFFVRAYRKSRTNTLANPIYDEEKKQSIEAVQMLESEDKDFKITVMNMLQNLVEESGQFTKSEEF